MSVVPLSNRPVRAIRIMERDGEWFARFAGDEWTRAFRTAPGPLPLVLDALIATPQRCGLPILVIEEVEF